MALHDINESNASTSISIIKTVAVTVICALCHAYFRLGGMLVTISKVEKNVITIKTNIAHTPESRDNSITNEDGNDNKLQPKIFRNGYSLVKQREKSKGKQQEKKAVESAHHFLSHIVKSPEEGHDKSIINEDDDGDKSQPKINKSSYSLTKQQDQSKEKKQENQTVQSSQHSLSHMRKSRSSNDFHQKKLEELELKLKRPKLKSLKHYFSHIPKSGSSYATFAINRLIFNSTEFHSRPRSQRFRSCMVRIPIYFWESYQTHHKGLKCTLHSSHSSCETQRDGWRCPAPYNYVILRQPRKHLLSQYFHCKESEDHIKLRHRMPDLSTWLTTWVRIKEEETTNVTNGEYSVYERSEFGCYNPVNSQSYWMAAAWNKAFLDGDLETRKNFLRRRYTVVGDQSQMDKTVCMITIHYAGWVPKQCNCSSSSSSSVTSEGGNNGKVYAGESIQIKKIAHGVKNHGGTHQTNELQDEMIAKLRDVDEFLYEAGKAVFEDQVKEVELKYDVQLCDKYTNHQ